MPNFTIKVEVDDRGAIRKIRNIDGAFGKLRRTSKSTGQAVGRNLANGFGLGAAKLRELGGQMQQFGGQAVRVGVVAAAALAGVVAIAVSQEQAFAGVRKTVEATEVQFRSLRSELRTLSETIPTSFSALSNIAEAGGQLGVLQKDLALFTETIARLGESTNLIGDEGAKALARFANITGTLISDVDRLGAVFVALGNTTATTEQEIATMALRLGAAGTVAGISAQEVLGLSAALSAAGVRAEAGGTAFGKLLINITNAVQTGGAQLENFAAVAGQSATDFAEAFGKDGAGALTSFLEGLKAVQDSGGNVFQILEKMGLSEIRLRNAILATTQSLDVFRGALDTSRVAFDANAALIEESNKRFATMGSQLRVVGNAVLNLAADLGVALFPIVKSTADVLRDFALSARAATSDTNSFANKLFQFGAAAGVAAGAIGFLAITVGALFVLLGGPVVAAIAAVTFTLAGLIGAAFAFRSDLHAAFLGIPVLAGQAADSLSALGLGFDNAGKSAREFFEASTLFGVPLTEIFGQVEESAEGVTEKVGLMDEAFEGFKLALTRSVPGLEQLIGLFALLRAEGQEIIAAQTFQTASAKNLAKETDNLAAKGLRLAKSQEVARETAQRLGLITDAVSKIMGKFAPKITDVTGKTKELTDGLNGLTVAQVVAAQGVETLFNLQFKAEDATRALSESVKEIKAPIIAMGASFGIAASAAEGWAARTQGAATMAGDSIADAGKRIGRINEAFKSLTTKSSAELRNLANVAQENFDLITATGLANIGQLLDAEKLALEAKAELFRANGVTLNKDEQKRLDELLELERTNREESIGIFEDWASGVESVVESLGADLFRGLFSGGFDNEAIQRKLRTLVDSFRDAFVSPVTKLFSGLVTGLSRVMDNLLSGQGTGGILSNLLGGGGSIGIGGGVASNPLGVGISRLLGVGGSVAASGFAAASAGGAAALSAGTFAGPGIGIVGANAGAAAGGTGLGSLAGSLIPFLTNPIGIAILGGIGAALGAYAIFTTSTLNKFRDEFARDFGGVNLTKDFVGDLLGSLDISKSQLEPIRKDIASAPVTLVAALEEARRQGKEEAFLTSLESVTNIFGEGNLRGGLEFGIATGDFTALNAEFVRLFENSTALTQTFGEELTPLLIDMAEHGVVPLTEKIRELEAAGLSQTDVFRELGAEIVLQITEAQRLNVTLDPLITQFGELVTQTEGLTVSQRFLLLSFIDLQNAPAAVGDALKLLVEDIQFLQSVGADSDQIFLLMGEQLQQAADAAKSLGIELPPLVAEILAVGNSVTSLVGPFQIFLDELDELRARPGEIAAEFELLIGAADVLRESGATNAEIFEVLNERLFEAVEAAEALGIEVPQAARELLALGDAAGDAADDVDDLTEAMEAFNAGIDDFTTGFEKSILDASNVTGQFTAAVNRMIGNGIDQFEAMRRAGEFFGKELVDVFNNLVFFGEEIPPMLQNLITLLTELGLAHVNDQGFLVMAKAANEAADAAERAGDAVERAGRRLPSRSRAAGLEALGSAVETEEERAAFEILHNRVKELELNNPNSLLGDDPFARQLRGGLTQRDITTIQAGRLPDINGGNVARFGAASETISLMSESIEDAEVAIENVTVAATTMTASAQAAADALGIEALAHDSVTIASVATATAMQGFGTSIVNLGSVLTTAAGTVANAANLAAASVRNLPARARGGSGGVVIPTAGVSAEPSVTNSPTINVSINGGENMDSKQLAQTVAKTVAEEFQLQGKRMVRNEVTPALTTAMRRNTGGFATEIKDQARQANV